MLYGPIWDLCHRKQLMHSRERQNTSITFGWYSENVYYETKFLYKNLKFFIILNVCQNHGKSLYILCKNYVKYKCAVEVWNVINLLCQNIAK